VIKSGRLLREVELKNDPTVLHKVHTRSFMDSQEFRLYRHIQTSFPHLTKDPGLTKAKRPSLKVTCFVARRPMYFIWNIFLIIVSTLHAVSTPQLLLYLTVFWFASASLDNPYCQSTWMSVCMSVCLYVCMYVRVFEVKYLGNQGS